MIAALRRARWWRLTALALRQPPAVTLKQIAPRSLFGRSMLIIVLPIAIMQVAVMWAFFDRHWVTVTSRLAESVAGDIAVILELYERNPSINTLDDLQAWIGQPTAISVALEEDAKLPTTVRSSFFDVLDRTLRQALADKLTHQFWFDTTRYPFHVEILVQVDAGVLRMVAPRDRVFASTGHIFLLWIIAASTLLTTVSLLYIRNQVRPIERLAAAADEFGRGQDTPNFKPAGALEVRQAAHAFLDMRERIRRHLEQRTTILAGVSHDLRTPLTRFKLQLALLPAGPDRDAMAKDVADMEAILNEYLAFARGAGEDAFVPTDLSTLVREVAGDVEHRPGADIRVHADTAAGLTVPIQPAAMKRCLENLVTNAAAFADAVRVTARRTAQAVIIDVDDSGPGIPEHLREEAFKPFNQLDRAGAKEGNRMGYGLGLAIARDAARRHGGDVILGESDLGGLRARVRLPASEA